MNKFTHLLVKSQYSFLESGITIPALVEKAKSLNMDYAALTDTSVLAKIPEFVRACQEADIKPLIGCEFSVFHYQHKNYTVHETNPEGADQVILFAMSMKGYKNLIQLSTLANINRRRNLKAHIFLQDLVEYSEDIYTLIITHTGTLGTFLDQDKYSEARGRVEKYIPIFSDKLAITHCDLLDPKDLKRLPHVISLGNELTIPIAAVNSVQTIHAHEAHEISLYSKDKQDNKPKLRQQHCWEERYFKTYKEMKVLFRPIPEDLENTEKIAGRIYFPFTLSDRENVIPISEQFCPDKSAIKLACQIVSEEIEYIS
jgi:DNA polymerase III subunit alpha